jgi:Zn-dependent metalloprotease
MGAGRVAQEHPLVRRVFSCAGSTTVPGALMRVENQPPCGDAESNRAFDAAGIVHAFWRDVFERDSLDGHGMHLIASVHFGEQVDNAWWDGAQMVYGDGDGIIIAGYTSSIEVVAHELAHGLLHSEWDLVYNGQSGALAESLADVFGSMVKQHAAGQSVRDADWLIGSQMFMANVSAFGLRSLREPGSAYDDPALGGRDPQVAHMRNLVKARRDDGAVHLNSGIPNYAFYRFACALGGRSWKVAGRVWYEALLSGLSPHCNFASFANATVRAAMSHGAEAVAAVCDAWEAVGVPVTAPRRRRRAASGG